MAKNPPPCCRSITAVKTTTAPCENLRLMSEIRYLLDENVEPAFRTALLQHDSTIIVWKIGDPGVPSTGTKDPEILRLMRRQSVYVGHEQPEIHAGTSERPSCKRTAYPGNSRTQPQYECWETVEELALIWGASDPHKYQDLILYLPLSE